MQAQSILVDIQALLDTRLATAGFISEDFGYQLATSNTYYDRSSDELYTKEFGKLSKQLYDDINKEYASEIFRLSTMTAYPRFLQELLTLQKEISVNSPITAINNIDVNVHPYILTEQESEEIVTALKYHLRPMDIDIRVVNIPPDKLTAELVSSRYMALTLYNPVSWIEAQKESFLKMAFSGITLYTPQVNHIRDLTVDEIKELDKLGDCDIFEVMQEVMKAYIRIQYIPIGAMSSNTVKNPRHTFRPMDHEYR